MNQVVFPTNPTHLITGVAPSKTLVKVTPHPMHYDAVCLMGTGCILQQGNRNLADFFEVNIDQSGAAEIVYDDTSNGLVQPGFTPNNNQTVDHAGAPLVSVARQDSGMGLSGTAVSVSTYGHTSAPIGGISDPSGDALFPVIGGANISGMDITGTSMNLSPDGHTLNVTTNVVDLNNPTLTSVALLNSTGLQQYVVRWQMGNTIYYAAMSTDASGLMPSFYAGKAQSVDLCSVSACFPHVLTYNEPNALPPTVSGSPEGGVINCPPLPSPANPCSLTVQVNVADVGNPNANSLLEEVGAYAFSASHRQNLTTNAQADADNVPLEIDGACCYNFKASVSNPPPPTCTTPGSIGTQTSTIVSNFNGTPIAQGRTIWFNSVLKASGLSSTTPTTIKLQNAQVTFSDGTTTYNVTVPNANITFSPTATTASTTYDAGTNTWNTTAPSSGLAGNVWLSGVGFVVPKDLPGGINPVSFRGTFVSNTPGVSLQWQWGAAVYTQFNTDPNALGVKPVDDNKASAYQNSDHAGTPESYKPYVTGGARGGGGSNYTGSYSGTASLIRCS